MEYVIQAQIVGCSAQIRQKRDRENVSCGTRKCARSRRTKTTARVSTNQVRKRVDLGIVIDVSNGTKIAEVLRCNTSKV